MNRSTPAKLARAERLERASPYARPAESKVKRSSSMISFPGLRSLVSYMTYPFSRSPSQKGLPFTNSDIAADQKSESGSEDGWNGEPSSSMQGKDVFDLASAGGRDGADFESRADKWRARGEKEGGRRELARKSLENANIADPPIKSPIMPGHLPSALRPTPSMPSLGESATPSFGTAVSSITNTLKRRLSPTKPARSLPPRSPLPAFAPVPPPITPAPPASSSSRLPAHATSASSVALKAFLDAKDGQPLNNEDLRVIESLTESARHESEAGSLRNEPQVGGWAAGSFTSRSIRPLPSTSTPNGQNGSAFGTPGSGFNMGISTPRTSTPGRRDSPGSVRYIGPGWSARRIYPQKKTGLKPLFSFNAEEEGIAKKRKVDSFESMDEGIPPVPPLPVLTASKSMPNLASSSRVTAPKSPVKKAASPVKPVEDAVAIGKRRAADIMLDLINSEIGVPKEKEVQPFIVNPYHPDAQSVITNKPSSGAAPASPLRNGTPRKSILKLSTNNQTPLRGAAKRLEEAKHTAPSPSKMTTLDMLTGRNGGEKETRKGKQAGKAVRIETPETEDEPSEVEDMVETPSAERRSFMVPEQQKRSATEIGPSGSPPKRARKAPEPEPVKPFTAPQLSSSTLPLPSSPASTFTFTPIASSSDSDGLRPTPQPKFTPSPLSRSIMPEEPQFSLGSSDSAQAPKASKKTGIYLTAKDTALSIAKEALPFFTFTFSMPTSSSKDSETTKRAKVEAIKRPLVTEFKFVLDPPTPAKTSMLPPPVPAATSAKPWTCTLCMLQNPASATEKCTICEAPKPNTSVPAGSKPFSPFTAPPPSTSTTSTSSGPWTCSLCMLENPGTATEKCTVCEEPKPAAAAATPKPFSSSSTATPSATSTTGTTQNKGFDWAAAGGKKPESGKAGTWTCGTCMLDNPDSAKEKCTVCEAPRV